MKARNTNRIEFAFVLCVVAIFHVAAQTPEHRGVVDLDAFSSCAAIAFEKPVFAADPWLRLNAADCATTKEAIVTKLSQRNVLWWDGGDAVFLRDKKDSGSRWDTLHIHFQVRNAELEGGRQLTPVELETVSRAVYKQARPALLFPDGHVSEDRSSTVDVVLSVDARSLRPGSESIVGVWGQDRGIGRLIYGELRAGRFELLWDSPLLKSFFWGLGYEDLDGDGIKEIVFRSDLTRDGRLYVIFDLQGHELSRQPSCETQGVFDEKSGTCPIVCEGIDIQPPGKTGTRDLLVYGMVNPNSQAVRMRLVNGHLNTVSQRPPR